eukprot:TRINITY_DN2545_c0_g4_i1.p1 TRINITY_DN2545_c0_g4~~TRINITY_DN2545_c0_g4_i1.p1  ORF type:complete len:113 (-),score=45.41 TRINITY_DN2545_c0_g4_i1:128-466(-)
MASLSAQEQELACTYAALLLHDDGVEITTDKIEAVLSAAGVTVEPFYPMLFAKFLQNNDVGKLLSNVGAAAAAAPAAASAPAAAGGAAAPAKKEEKKVEEEEDEEMGFGLFD